MIDLCSRLLFWTVVYVAAARLGAWISRSELRGVAHLAWDGLAGLPLLMAGWMTLGLFRFDRFSVTASLAALLALAAWRALRDPVARFRGLERPFDRVTILTLALLAVVALIGLLWDRVPVLFYDSLAYHFAQPESWILEGRIAPYEWSLHSWFPPGMSVLYGVGLLLGGEAWANDANLMIGIAMTLLIFDFARRLWGSVAGSIALVVLLCVPQILFAAAIPAADLAHGAFVAATLGALMLAREGDRNWTRRAAWIAAGALLTKYLGLVVPLLAGFVFCALNRPRGSGAVPRLRAATLFCIPALLMLGPWLIANTIEVGNPVAPVASSALGVEGLAPGGAAAFTRDARGGLPGSDELSALVPRLFAGEDHGIYPSPAWGWPFLAWAVLAVLGALKDSAVRNALAVAGLLAAIWFATYRWERFLVAVAFFVCLALAGTLWRWARASRAGALLAVFVVLTGAAYVPRSGASIARYTGAADVFYGRKTPQEFIQGAWPLRGMLEVVPWEPASDRLLLVGEMRHFRVPVPRAAPTGFNEHPLVVELDRAVAVEQVHEALRRRGFTHLLVDIGWVHRGAEQYPSLRPLVAEPTKFRSYLASLGTPLVSHGGRAVYAIPEQR